MADAVQVYNPAGDLEGTYDTATDTMQIVPGNGAPPVVANRESIATLANRLLSGESQVGTGCFASHHALPNGHTLAAMPALLHDLYLALQQAAPAYVGWVLPSNLLSGLQPRLGIPLRLTIVDELAHTNASWEVTEIRATTARRQPPTH